MNSARSVALRLRNYPESFRQFQDMVANREEFVQRLQRAQEDPHNKESTSLLQYVLRTLVCIGKNIPWSGQERSAELTHLYALWRYFGAASCFITAAPDDLHHPTAIRLSYAVKGLTEFPATVDGFIEFLQASDAGGEQAPRASFDIPLNERSLQESATVNPVATTMVYEELTETVFTYLIGLRPALRRKTVDLDDDPALHKLHKGVLATPRAWMFVTETNGRKSLHFHGVLFSDPSPQFLAKLRDYDGLRQCVCDCLDGLYRCYASPDLHVLDVAKKSLYLRRRTQSWFMPLTKDLDGDDVREHTVDADVVALTNNMHSHMHTVIKQKLAF